MAMIIHGFRAAKAGVRTFSTPGYLIAGGDKPGAIDGILARIDDLDSVLGSPWQHGIPGTDTWFLKQILLDESRGYGHHPR